jgi:GTP-dependent phosphoenolpyruvate carboxykinase
LLEIHKKDWLEELKGIKKSFAQFKKDLPKEMWDEFEALKERLEAA